MTGNPPQGYHERRVVIPVGDKERGWHKAAFAADQLRRACRDAAKGKFALEFIVRPLKKPVTDPQRRTFRKWHSEVASELSVRTGMRWTGDDVHEVIFIPRFMPSQTITMPDGTEVVRHMRTSDKPFPGEERSARKIVSDAMDDYLRWIYDQDIEVTVPEEGWL